MESATKTYFKKRGENVIGIWGGVKGKGRGGESDGVRENAAELGKRWGMSRGVVKRGQGGRGASPRFS